MSVHIFDENAFDKIGEVEGEEWKHHQNMDPDNECSFQAFYQEWKQNFSGKKDLMERGREFNVFISVNGNGAIYGLWGFNRYAVRCDGRIFFLRDLATKSDLEKAIQVGFDIM